MLARGAGSVSVTTTKDYKYIIVAQGGYHPNGSFPAPTANPAVTWINASSTKYDSWISRTDYAADVPAGTTISCSGSHAGSGRCIFGIS